MLSLVVVVVVFGGRSDDEGEEECDGFGSNIDDRFLGRRTPTAVADFSFSDDDGSDSK